MVLVRAATMRHEKSTDGGFRYPGVELHGSNKVGYSTCSGRGASAKKYEFCVYIAMKSAVRGS